MNDGPVSDREATNTLSTRADPATTSGTPRPAAPAAVRHVDPPPDPGTTRRRLLRGAIVLVVLVGTAALLLASLSTFDETLRELGRADPAWIVAALACELLAVAGYVTWTRTVYPSVPAGVARPMLLASSGANAIVVGSGSAGITSWCLYRLGMKPELIAVRASTAVIANSVNNLGLMAIVGVLLWLGVLDGEQRPALTLVPAGIAVAIIVVGGLLGVAEQHRLDARQSRMHHVRVQQALRVLAEGVTGTIDVFRRAGWRLVGLAADTVGNATVLWAALQAIGTGTPWGVAAMAYLLGKLLGAIPVPGGIGVLDLGITGALVLYGVRAPSAAAGDILAHAIYLSVPILLGLAAAPLLRRAMERTHLPASVRA